MSGPGERAILPPTMEMRARAGQRGHAVDERVYARHGQGRRQHERQKRDARRRAHGREVAQIHRERLVADVCRADKRLIEVYAFDLAIGSENFERVPFWLQRLPHRRRYPQ